MTTRRISFATAVVLSVLAAPLDSTAPRSLVTLIDGDGDSASRNMRLAEYLNMTKAPTRDLLMRELVRSSAGSPLGSVAAPQPRLTRLHAGSARSHSAHHRSQTAQP